MNLPTNHVFARVNRVVAWSHAEIVTLRGKSWPELAENEKVIRDGDEVCVRWVIRGDTEVGACFNARANKRNHVLTVYTL